MICLALLICESWKLCDAAPGCGGKWAAQKHIRVFSLSLSLPQYTQLQLWVNTYIQTHTDAFALTQPYAQTCAHLWKQEFVFGCTSISCPESSQLIYRLRFGSIHSGGLAVFFVSAKSNPVLTETMQVRNKHLRISTNRFSMVQKTVMSHSLTVSVSLTVD